MSFIHTAIKGVWMRAKGSLARRLSQRLSLIELCMLQLEKRIGQVPFFIQVGANDGSMADPFSLISKRWSGLMIEPQPDVFERLVEARSAGSRVQFANVAISDSEGEFVLYGIGLPGSRQVTGIASLDKEVILKHIANGYVDGIARNLRIALPADPQELITETQVRICPLSKLIEERSIPRVDALFVDVEGHELQVLESFPWAQLRPSLVVYEQIHLRQDTATACAQLLRAQGYALINDGMDVVAVAGESVA